MIWTRLFSSILTVVFFLSTASVLFAKPMAFPSKGQSKEQQELDDFSCHKWAKNETGVDPYQMASAQSTAPQSSGGGEIIRGGARGAALGAIGGAVAGDAGKGAKIGAAVGGAGGAMNKRRTARGRQAQAQQQQAQGQANMAQFEKAWGLCMKAKGYVVG